MRRRVEIARCGVHTPRVIFMDEPTAGLDPQTRNHLWNQLKKLNQYEGVTIFLTTHHMEEAEQMAHRIIIIDHGKIIAQGTAKSIQEQTDSETLNEAFIALTGTAIRPDYFDSQNGFSAPRGKG